MLYSLHNDSVVKKNAKIKRHSQNTVIMQLKQMTSFLLLNFTACQLYNSGFQGLAVLYIEASNVLVYTAGAICSVSWAEEDVTQSTGLAG
jgi:hypothetical protein